MKLAYLPQPGVVRLRLTAFGENRQNTANVIDKQVSLLKELIPGYIFGYDKDTLETVAGRLLKEKDLSVSTA